MVDYSKWDKMDVSDSSDSEGEPTPRPKVTKFDTEQKVTFGGNRDHEVTIAPGTSPGNTPEQQGTSPAPNQTTTASSEGPQTSSSALSRETVLAQWTRNGGTVFSQQLRATSSEARPFPTYHWAQTRDSVTIRFELGAAGQAPEDAADADEDAADAEVSGAALRRDWTGKDVRIGVSTKMVGNRLRSVVSIKDLFDGEVVLQYEVEAPEQAEDIDWEFEYLPSGGAADSRTAQDLGSGGENRGKKHMRLTVRQGLHVGAVGRAGVLTC